MTKNKLRVDKHILKDQRFKSLRTVISLTQKKSIKPTSITEKSQQALGKGAW
jgi:hypothetical protein